MSNLSQFFSGGKLIPIEVFAVGAGGGGGIQCGGGAGAAVYKMGVYVSTGVSYPITIGAGGAGAPVLPPPAPLGITGGTTSLGSLVVAGGGGGGNLSFSDPLSISFGSLGGQSSTPIGPGTRISRFDSFGIYGANPGGLTSINASAGGGGALTQGTNAPGVPSGAPPGGDGGYGISGAIIGLTTTYAGGGAGGGFSPGLGPIGVGGLAYDGGGSGGAYFTPAGNGSLNRGGGGGGGSITPLGSVPAGAGGSGFLFIRYPTAYAAASSVSGNTATTAQPGYNVYMWNGSGSITF